MSNEEKPGFLEKYSAAINSSHLEIVPHRRGAADFLTDFAFAHGVHGLGDQMGGMLMRLMCEFSLAKGEYVQARRNQANSLARSKEQKDIERAAEMVAEADKNATLAHAHILLKVPSLARTREAFGNWCMVQAGKQHFMACGDMPIPVGAKFSAWRKAVADRQNVVSILSGRVLDVFLEPTCIRCSGRGFSGGYNGGPQIKCNNRGGCGGSGKRPIDNIGNSREQHDFSYYLYGQAERLLTNVEIQLAERLRDEPAKAVP